MADYFKSSMVGKCCMNCEERFLACHDVCSKYLQAKAEWDERRERVREAKNKHKTYEAYHFSAVSKQYKHNINRK